MLHTADLSLACTGKRGHQHPHRSIEQVCPSVAFAFHEQIAMERLNNYFASGDSGGESRAMKCSKCSLAFAVVLVDRTDKNNSKYIDDLRGLIDDCINGLHRDEYTLAAGAAPED
jgi:hypothetical protein